MVLRRSRLERGAEQLCLQTGGGCSRSSQDLVFLPTGVGATVTLPKGNVTPVGDGAWLPDSKRIVFTGDPADHKPRGYFRRSQPAFLARSHRRAWFSPTNRRPKTRTPSSAVLGATWMLFPIQGGDGRPVPALTPGDIPVQWSHGGRYVFTVANVDGARPAAVDVFRVELASGSRTLWKTLTPSDPVGVEDMRETLVITPDAQSVLLHLHATARRPVRGRRLK